MNTSMSNYNKEHMAIAFLKGEAISTKHSVELARFIKHRSTAEAKALLEKIIVKKEAVPFKRYKRDLAHRTAIGPGRYPINAAKAFLRLVKTAEANAQHKSLAAELEIVHCVAYGAVRSWHYGRKRRRKNKSATVELVVAEIAKDKKEKQGKHAASAASSKKESKTEKSEDKK